MTASATRGVSIPVPKKYNSGFIDDSGSVRHSSSRGGDVRSDRQVHTVSGGEPSRHVAVDSNSVPRSSSTRSGDHDTDVSISLEGLVRIVGERAARPHVGLLVLHPYSFLGGSMHDAVVMEVFRQGQACRHFGAVMTYNMRGVGRSEGGGSSSVIGSSLSTMARRVVGTLPFLGQRGADESRKSSSREDDARDVEHVIDYLIRAMEQENPAVKDRVQVVLVGYSYGAALAAQAIHHSHVCRYVGISIPIGKLASLFLRSKQYCLEMLLTKEKQDMPRLLVLGKNDQYTTEQQLIDCVLLSLSQRSSSTIESSTLSSRSSRSKTALRATNAPAGEPSPTQISKHDHKDRSVRIQDEVSDIGGIQRRQIRILGSAGGDQEICEIAVDVFENNDHFWSNDCACMIEHVISWLIDQDL